MTEKKLLLPATPEGLRTLAKLVGQHLPHATLTGAKVTNLDPLRIIEDGDDTDSSIEDYSTFPDRIDQPAIVLRQGQRRLLVPMTGDIRALTEDVGQIKDTTDKVVVDVGVTDLAVEQVVVDVDEMGTTIDNLQGRLDTAFDNVTQVGIDSAEAVLAAEAAQSTANGATAIITGTASTGPSVRKNGTPVQANDLYYQLTTDNPPRLMNILQRNATNTGWHIQRIIAASIFVPGSITGILIEDDAITARTVNVASLQAAIVTADAISGKTITGVVIKSGVFQTHDDGGYGSITISPRTQTASTNLTAWQSGNPGIEIISYSEAPYTPAELVFYSRSANINGHRRKISIDDNGIKFYTPTGGADIQLRRTGDNLFFGSTWLNAPGPTLPRVFQGVVASGSTIAAYGLLTASVSISGVGTPSGIIPVITSGPGGSSSWVPRVASWTASTATIRFYNTSAVSSTINGDLLFNVIAIP